MRINKHNSISSLMADDDDHDRSYHNLLEDHEGEGQVNHHQQININQHLGAQQFQPQIPPQIANLQLNQEEVLPIQIDLYIGLLKTQLLRVSILFGLLFIYCLVQMILANLQAIKYWNDALPVQKYYILSVMVQFGLHSFCLLKLELCVKQSRDETLLTNGCPETMETFVTYEIVQFRTIRFSRIVEYYTQKLLSLTTFNKILYFWMFILGFFGWIQRNREFDNWYLFQLLLPGWIMATVITTIFGVLCVGAPILLCYYCYKIRHERRSRQENMQRAVPPPVKYETLEAPSGQPCYICLNDFQPADVVIQLRCHPNHVTHEDCLRPWLETQTCCPVCRKEIR